MSKHTPGPWSFYTEPQPNGCPIVGSRGLMVCMLAHTVNQPEQRAEAIANARLIAAAPLLLEALEQMVKWYASRSLADDTVRPVELQLTEVQLAMRAIAAATGEDA